MNSDYKRYIEKKAEIGAPLRCAEGVSKKWLEEVGIEPDPTWIRGDMKGRFYP